MGTLFQLIDLHLRSRYSQRDDRGASLVEYALLVALIAIVCIVAVEVLGEQTSANYREYGESLTAARN